MLDFDDAMHSLSRVLRSTTECSSDLLILGNYFERTVTLRMDSAVTFQAVDATIGHLITLGSPMGFVARHLNKELVVKFD